MMIKRKSAIKDFGGDGETVILLHGFLASTRYWTKLQPYLSTAGYHVIAIDLLGFGKAPKPKESDYAYDDHVTHVHDVIKDLHVHTPFTLVGHSMGALVAARYSRIHAGHINKLILLHPPLYKDAAEAYATLRRTNALYRFLLDSHYRRIGWILVKTFAPYHLGSHSRLGRERSLRNVIEKAEAFDDLRTITATTLLVIGLKDRLEYTNNLTGHAINKTVTVIHENVTHHSPIQEPELIQNRIIRFINSQNSQT